MRLATLTKHLPSDLRRRRRRHSIGIEDMGVLYYLLTKDDLLLAEIRQRQMVNLARRVGSSVCVGMPKGLLVVDREGMEQERGLCFGHREREKS